jgi:hypothetical protein
MPLLVICCPHCGHSGYVAADRVPGMLRCSGCEFVGMVKEGKRMTPSRFTAALNADDEWAKNGRKKRVLIPPKERRELGRQRRELRKLQAPIAKDDAA